MKVIIKIIGFGYAVVSLLYLLLEHDVLYGGLVPFGTYLLGVVLIAFPESFLKSKKE